jgi:anti-sigma factor RsiW
VHEEHTQVPGARGARHGLPRGRALTADRKRFDAHIAACPHCTLYIEQLRQTIALTGTLREEDVQPDARDALLKEFAQWKQERA